MKRYLYLCTLVATVFLIILTIPKDVRAMRPAPYRSINRDAVSCCVDNLQGKCQDLNLSRLDCHWENFRYSRAGIIYENDDIPFYYLSPIYFGLSILIPVALSFLISLVILRKIKLIFYSLLIITVIVWSMVTYLYL